MGIANGSQLAMLTVSALTISRGERTLFRDLSLGVASGEAVALTGANGAGKTSLLRAIAGFIRPDAGTIEFTAADAAEARAKHLHWLGHLDGLKGARRAGDELAFVIEGALEDESGTIRPGILGYRPNGCAHQVRSPYGATTLSYLWGDVEPI